MATLDVNPELYQAQLADKIARLKAMFVDYSMPELEVFESPVANYRMRAEFRIWHEGD
ncbi:tRNA (uridine(54)-C5)-methyltransferase TrmA, partial [Salmonella enterica subsp. enterica serovar Kentucky]|nr:tRNA (uridine(54)-C5)-methyltransferase TrmA [Salmonella enterica subsp. enterica serovar Kentucky]